jgi:hypothetical protein
LKIPDFSSGGFRRWENPNDQSSAYRAVVGIFIISNKKAPISTTGASWFPDIKTLD